MDDMKTKAGVNALLNNRAQSPPQQGVFGVQPPSIEVEPPSSPSVHIHNRRATPHSQKIHYQEKASQQLSTHIEEEHSEDEQFEQPNQTELDDHAKASFMNLWMDGSGSGSGSESGDEPLTDTPVITELYRDPLDACMEGIEDLATGILRTGRLSLQGEPGDMAKVQPMMFGLQPMEKEIPQLLPQLLQVPLFLQKDQESSRWEDSFPEDFLTTGHVRLGIPIDTIIYHMLRSHCAKGAKQAEELIKTAQSTSSALQSPYAKIPMPPVIFTSIIARPRPPTYFKVKACNGSVNGLKNRTDQSLEESMGDDDAIGSDPPQQGIGNSKSANTTSTSSVSTAYSTEKSRGNTQSMEGNTQSLEVNVGDGDAIGSDPPLQGIGNSKSANTTSTSSVSTTYSTEKSRGNSSASILSSNTSSSSLPGQAGEQSVSARTGGSTEQPAGCDGDKGNLQDDTKKTEMQAIKETRARKDSRALPRPIPRTFSSGSEVEISGDEFGMEKKFVVDSNTWNVTVLDNTTVVAMYGETTYPLLMWNPALKVDFRLSSSIGILTGTVTGIDSSHPVVTINIVNRSPHRVAFSVIVHRQSTILHSHVVFPAKGLHILEQYQCWEDNADFYLNPKSLEMNEYFIIDVFVATLDENASWNILRKYAVMKGQKSQTPSQGLRRLSKRFTQFQMPGNSQQKEENLQQIISHGLQCVVKSKLDEAEIIFTQALHLPDFQRVPLKAFVYICLAIIKNKRRRQENVRTLIPILTMLNGATQLVEVYENTPGVVKMPRMLQLVKQLKKELNIEKVIHQRRHHRGRTKLGEKKREESELFTPEGGTLHYNSATIKIPPGALTTDMKITLSKPDPDQLDSILHSTGWDKTVRIVAAFHLQCSVETQLFQKPISIKTLLPESLHLGSTSLVRLLQSNYLRHWQDITEDSRSQVLVLENNIHISTDRTGWLAVTLVQLDASKIAQMAMKSLSIEPIMLRFSAYCQTFPDDINQIAVFVVPCKANEEPIHQDNVKPQHHVPIAFPHTVQAWPGEKLRFELQGRFEPDESSGEKELSYEFEAQQTHNRIFEKWVKLTSITDQSLSGKLIVSACRHVDGQWESVTEINLSSRSRQYSNSSGSDTHQS